MIFKIPTLIEYISKYITLNEGDLIMTGTPSGVGPVRKGDFITSFLKDPMNGNSLTHLELKVDRI